MFKPRQTQLIRDAPPMHGIKDKSIAEGTTSGHLWALPLPLPLPLSLSQSLILSLTFHHALFITFHHLHPNPSASPPPPENQMRKGEGGGSQKELGEGPGVVDLQMCWGFPEQRYKGPI